jgi:hypothetical protein
MLITEIRLRPLESKRDACHANSLFRIKVLAITFFREGQPMANHVLRRFLGEKCDENEHEDIQWTLDFRMPLVILFAIGSTVANALTIGTANSVKPEASGSIAGTLSAGSGVHANETVKTGSTGQAGLQFNDHSNLTVGPSSSVRLDKFVYDPNRGSGSIAIEAARGAFRFASQNKVEVKIKTPLGTLGIRG